MTEETYLRVTAPITPLSAQRLLQVVDQKYQAGFRKLHLLLSTPGGSVAHGIAIYNFLRGIPMEVVTHNFGTVDSIGIIIFCAGERRLSVPHARFFLHPIGMDIVQPTRLDEHSLREQTALIKIDQENIAKIIAAHCGKDQNAVLRDIAERTSLNPEEAKQYGLIHKTEEQLLPMSADFVPIYESEATQPAQVPIQMPVAQNMPVSIPPESGTSTIRDSHTCAF